jgi:SlyX protein
MTENELASRLESLELRLMHQEAAIEELTRTVLQQEQLIATQVVAIERLEAMLRSLSDTNTASPGEEPPPPHY